ncbi:hypothetical protein HD806DRAFT_541932 [Xylariaceae sp. AK1471]|nr:hypothetical protein HD806DRAFT_541932 [Xylariaceae sp. AK1471]
MELQTILADNYTVIAPDNRGASDSSILPDDNHSATASVGDLKGIYEEFANPTPYYDLYQNLQLAMFQIPDVAEFLINGREKQFLEWYFYHGSYSGPASFSEDTFNRVRVESFEAGVFESYIWSVHIGYHLG